MRMDSSIACPRPPISGTLAATDGVHLHARVNCSMPTFASAAHTALQRQDGGAAIGTNCSAHSVHQATLRGWGGQGGAT
jgi:hypothetical protein